MAWVAVAIGGAAVVNYMGSQRASSAAADANNQNIASQERMNASNQASQEKMQASNLANVDKWNTLNNPFSATGQRQQYVGQLNGLMSDPNAMSNTYNDPVFQAQLNQGTEAVSRRLNASGQGGSGNELASIMQYTMGNARTAYQDKYAMLSSLSGANSTGGNAYQGQAYQGQAPQGMSPSTAYGMTAAPYQALSSSMNTLAGIYGNRQNPPATQPTTA